MSTDNWRIIRTKPLEGAWNMAVDEAILEAVTQGLALPTLRLYAWSPPCLSLGYAQPCSDVDQPALKAAGWGLVRRPTGGRAILHTDELTYSVIAPLHEQRVAGTVLESYQKIAQPLLFALQLIGLQARADKAYALPPGGKRNGPVCFEVPSNYEITADGKKLIGSAQARRLGGILQHGSLPLTGDLARITRCLIFTDDEARENAASRLLAHAVTIETVLGRPVAWDQAANAFQQAFSTCLAVELSESHLTGFEMQRAQELIHQKYGNPEWTARI